LEENGLQLVKYPWIITEVRSCDLVVLHAYLLFAPTTRCEGFKYLPHMKYKKRSLHIWHSEKPNHLLSLFISSNCLVNTWEDPSQFNDSCISYGAELL